MVVGHRHDVNAKLLKDFHIFRIGPECELFVFHGLAPQTERKFFINDKEIRILHAAKHLTVSDSRNTGFIIGG